MNKAHDTKEIFVAYPYALYNRGDYRRVYQRVGREFGVKVVFADEHIVSEHILAKIRRSIQIADFSVFDISGWNPNVTLELGMAFALGESWFICYNPEHNSVSEVPGNLRGLDRIQYRSFSELEDGLVLLMNQRYSRRGERRESRRDQVAPMKRMILGYLRSEAGGLPAAELAELLGCSRKVASVILNEMVKDGGLGVSGATRGARYFIKPR